MLRMYVFVSSVDKLKVCFNGQRACKWKNMTLIGEEKLNCCTLPLPKAVNPNHNSALIEHLHEHPPPDQPFQALVGEIVVDRQPTSELYTRETFIFFHHALRATLVSFEKALDAYITLWN